MDEDFNDSSTHFDHTIQPHELKILKEFFDRFKVSFYLGLIKFHLGS